MRRLNNDFGTELVSKTLEEARIQQILETPPNPRSPYDFDTRLRQGGKKREQGPTR